MDESLRIALVQTELKWEDPAANRDLFTEKINQIDTQVNLIVLPEMFTTGFTMHPERIDVGEGARTLEWMKTLASKKQAAITGSIVFADNGTYYNRLFFVFPRGNHVSYDKRHTFTLAGEHKVYKAGDEKVLITYKGFKICPLICYDLRFPVWARNTENYDVLLYVANWPKPRTHAWDSLLQARAIENMSYVIGVNRIGADATGHEYLGHSAVYDVLGKAVVFSKKDEVLFASLSKQHLVHYREKLRFLDDRDTFSLL